MNEDAQGNRYCYSLLRSHVRRDMWGDTNFFWSTWGVRKTLKFIVSDTFREWRKTKGAPNV